MRVAKQQVAVQVTVQLSAEEEDEEEIINITQGPDEEAAAMRFQAIWRGFRSRRELGIFSAAKLLLENASGRFDAMSQVALDERTRESIAMMGHADEATIHAFEQAAAKAKERVDALKQARQNNTRRRHRHCWWIPTQHTEVLFDNMADQRVEICRRQCLMIRRATLQWYFSSEQVARVLETIPHAGRRRGQVEALVTMFSRITDLENVRFDRLLGFEGYDRDGNHYVSAEELKKMSGDPFVYLNHRLGPANLFNPLRPEREYALNLRNCDERTAAQLLVVLSSEPGDNILYESYNEMPFDVGKAWETACPPLGIFCCEFYTPPDCGSLAIRIPLAQRLLMPGRDRWRSIPEEMLLDDEDPEEFDGATNAATIKASCTTTITGLAVPQVARTTLVGPSMLTAISSKWPRLRSGCATSSRREKSETQITPSAQKKMRR
jgi:hypothetical protein